MKKYTMYLAILTLLFAACSSSLDDEPKPEYNTTITVGEIPDSVKVVSTTNITFTVSQENHTENFKIEVDTVVPNYWIGKIFREDGTPSYQHQRFGSADIQVNGTALASLTTIAPGEENTITFANPTMVGEYKITLKITDKDSKITNKEIVVKVVSPEIEIRWYSQNLLRYYFSDVVDNMYENLK